MLFEGSIRAFNSFLFESVYWKGVSHCFVLVVFKYLLLVNSSRSSLSFNSRYLLVTPFAIIDFLLVFWIPKTLATPRNAVKLCSYITKRDHRHNTSSAICFVSFYKLSFMHVCWFFRTVGYYTILWLFSANKRVPVIFRSFPDEYKHYRFRKTPSY